MVGNDPGCLGLEVLGGGFRAIATADHLVAVTGATGPLSVDGTPVNSGRAVLVRRGQVFRCGSPVAGLRWTVAVAGGFIAPAVLGSSATDLLGQLGPAALAAGDELNVGPTRGQIQLETLPGYLPTGEVAVQLFLGPRDDWFTTAAIETLLSTSWTVEADSDRIGIRLAGPRLERVHTAELASEPVIRGSIQVTGAGLPVILGPDHPVTGGYPVIAVVRDHDTDLLAQLRPGDHLRFDRARAT